MIDLHFDFICRIDQLFTKSSMQILLMIIVLGTCNWRYFRIRHLRYSWKIYQAGSWISCGKALDDLVRRQCWFGSLFLSWETFCHIFDQTWKFFVLFHDWHLLSVIVFLDWGDIILLIILESFGIYRFNFFYFKILRQTSDILLFHTRLLSFNCINILKHICLFWVFISSRLW
jgi:hypothetical protein